MWLQFVYFSYVWLSANEKYMSGLMGHCEYYGIEMLGTDISKVIGAICFPDLDLMNRKK